MRAQAWIVTLASLAAGQPALADTAASRPTLADVAFIAGHWKGDMGGALSEEIWVPPAGDSMMGMWRLVAGGQVKLFEFLNIVQEAEGPVFRLRHFDRLGVGREDRDKPIVLKLVSSKPREAAFEGPESSGAGTVRLTYRRTSDEALSVTLEKASQPPQEFTFRLAAPLK
jgi:hypothetical protein